MRWIIEKIILQGFRSFKQKQEFDFSVFSTPAFVFVSGENKVDIELEGNGAGKSTLFSALQYCLFGRTLEVKGTDLKSWKSKYRCLVETHLITSDNEKYVITRQRDPNKLTVSKDGLAAVVVEQNELEVILGYNLDSFGYAVVVSQFAKKFFDLSPSDKMELFDSIMKEELEVWMRLSERAKDEADTLYSQVGDMRLDIANLQGQLEAMKEIDYSKEIKEWEADKIDRINTIEKAIELADENKRNADNDLEKFKKDLKREQKDLEVWQDKSNSVSLDIVLENKNFNKIDGNMRVLDNEISGINKQIKVMEGIKGSCPTCKQPATVKHLAVERLKLEKQVSSKSKEFISLESRLNFVRQKLSNLESELKDSKTKISDSKVNYYEKEISTCKYDIERYEEVIEDGNKNITKIKKEDNPYTKRVEENKREIIRTERKLERATEEFHVAEQQADMKRYWQKGFKEVRFSVVAGAVLELEILVNDYLARLGLVDEWEIKIEMDKETKSKSIQKGFTIFIASPENAGAFVPFECWSGGEGQRLRLAGTLALMDFIHDRRGNDWSIEIFDEPTQWLSESGIEDLLEVLKQRSEEKNRQLFIIDHRDFASSGDFDYKINVVKDSEGSKINI